MNSRNVCEESLRNRKTSCTFLDNFDKAYEPADRKRIVLTEEFCTSNFGKKCGGSGGGNSDFSDACCSNYKTKSKNESTKRPATCPKYEPFGPKRDFRNLAYSPLKDKKYLNRKISTNTIHGVDSVNDLRAWSFSKEERRQHYLDQMMLTSVGGGGGSSAAETEPDKPKLVGYKESHAPIQHFTKNEPSSFGEPSKEKEKVISEQYQKEREKERESPSSKQEEVKKMKEIQTPKLSVSNILEELSTADKNKLFEAMSQERGGAKSTTKGDDDGSNAKAKDDEIQRLLERLKELQNKYDALQKERDSLAAALEKEKASKMSSDKLPEDTTLKSSSKPQDQLSESGKLGPTQEAREQFGSTAEQPGKTGSSSEQPGNIGSTSEQPGNLGSTPELLDTTSKLPTFTADKEKLKQADCSECEAQLLQCEYLLLEFNNLELQRQLQTERRRGEQMLCELQRLENDFTQLQLSHSYLESEFEKTMFNENDLSAAYYSLQAQVQCALNDKIELAELNKTLEKEVVQLRSQIGSLYNASTGASGIYDKCLPAQTKLNAQRSQSCDPGPQYGKGLGFQKQIQTERLCRPSRQ